MRGLRPPPGQPARPTWSSAAPAERAGLPGPWSARPSSPPRPFTPERHRRSRVCPAEGEGRAEGGGGGVVVLMRRGLLCPCAEMTHGVPSRHARAQRTDTQRGENTRRPLAAPSNSPGRRGQALPRASPTPWTGATPHPHVAPNSARTRSAKYRTRVPGKCGADQAGCAAPAARGGRTGERLQHPCRGGGREEGRGRGGGLPGARPAAGAPTPVQGRAAERAPGAHGLAAPIVPRTPLCRSERGGSMASPGARAPRGGGGGGRGVEWSAPPSLPAPLAPRAGPAPLPGAPRWSGRGRRKALRSPWGFGARVRPGCGGGRFGVKKGVSERSRGRGLEGDAEGGARGQRSRRSGGGCHRSLQME